MYEWLIGVCKRVIKVSNWGNINESYNDIVLKIVI